MRPIASLSLILAAVSAVSLLPSVSMAADHRDAPTVRLDGRTDINDIYVFKSPTNPNNSVLMLTTNPFSGVLSPLDYSSTAVYDLEIYNDGDLVPDVVYRSTFTAPDANGNQNVTIKRNNSVVASGPKGSDLPVAGGGLAHVGNFDDPFFFDLVGFNSGFAFTGTDAFANANTNAIILEIPSSQLHGASTVIKVGARTADAATNTQIDRTGRPAINPALIPGPLKDAFNLGTPATDFATFGDTAKASITALSNAANADALAPIFLPDLLDFDSSIPTSYLNGRGLTDDVIDLSLNVLSVGVVTTDLVNGNDKAFRNTFPYLAAPIFIPEPSAFALVGAAGLLTLRRKRS